MGRKPIPENIQAEVLFQSGRRCCICFGLYQKFDVVKGQIAHLDHNTTNNALENLAFLCFNCHDEYDSRTSQSKGLTQQEVKRYRNLLSQTINNLRSSQKTQAEWSKIPYDKVSGIQTIEGEQAFSLSEERLNLGQPRQSISFDQSDVLTSELEKDYRTLRNLLAENDWQSADMETMALMREVFGREEVKKIPIVDLQTIDSLWLKYSNNRFGFSVQRRVLEYTFRDSKVTPETCLPDYKMLNCIEDYSDRLSERWRMFGEKLGWYNEEKLIKAIDYSHNVVKKPEGYLPLLGVAPQFRLVQTNRSRVHWVHWWWVLLLRLKPWKS